VPYSSSSYYQPNSLTQPPRAFVVVTTPKVESFSPTVTVVVPENPLEKAEIPPTKITKRDFMVDFQTKQDEMFAHYSYRSVGDYPQMATRRLTYADIAGKSSRELRIMRNEIYAQYGYRFNSYDLQNHFEKKSWYKPIAQNLPDF
jgi:hypothetical protein